MMLPLKRRVFRNCLLAIVILFSVTSFLVFTTYANVKSETSHKFLRELNIKRNEDSQFVHRMAQDIRLLEEKIINHSRSSATFKQKLTQPTREVGGKLSKTRNMSVLTQDEKIDGKYAHRNHELLPHWSDKTVTQLKHHVPPDDIGANFYPQLGPYSSSDPVIMDAHMKQIRASGAGVLAISWYPPGYEDNFQTPVDDIIMKLLDVAGKYEMKIAFHVEPYKNRNGETLRDIVKYAIDRYGNHTAFYRFKYGGKELPVFYVYDSYQIKPTLWADALTKGGKFSVRDTEYDAIFLGLLVEFSHFNHLVEAGFDGFYTYFASNGFVYGSTWENWPKISAEAKKRNLIFVPSIGPGYLDTRVRAWNGKNTKLRLNGRYYRSAFQSALSTRPALLTITSFNEWHEGTQVEPAVPKVISDFKYEDYQPNDPDFYLNLTMSFVQEYGETMSHLK